MDRDAPAFILSPDEAPHDGDTLKGFIAHQVTMHIQGVAGAELHGQVWLPRTIRVMHIDAPETRGATRRAGLDALAALTEWLEERTQLYLVTEWKEDRYGRLLAEVWAHADTEGDLLNEPQSLHEFMLSTGHATPYEGGKR